MVKSPRWAQEVGGLVDAPGGHVARLMTSLREVASYGPDKAFPPILERALLAAYQAGVREGRSEVQASLGAVMRDRVRRAVESIQVEPARCPHCWGGDSRDCKECHGTGNRHA